MYICNFNQIGSYVHVSLSLHIVRLMDVLHCDRKLFLVFEYLDYDLKKYMDRHAPSGIPVENAKVSYNACLLSSIMSTFFLHTYCSHFRATYTRCWTALHFVTHIEFYIVI